MAACMDNMEGVPQAQIPIVGGIHSSCRRGRRHSGSSQTLPTLRLLMLIAQITWAMAERNTHINYTYMESGSKGVWNKTLQKDMLNCTQFHYPNASTYFYHWPEDSFQHCCEFSDNQTLIKNESLHEYRYHMYGNPLFGATYYDVGQIDNCFPFWKCGYLYTKYQDTTTFYMHCEYKDLIRLYTSRFYYLVVLKYGLLATALPLILTLELAACLMIFFRHRYSPPRHASLSACKIGKEWLADSWKKICIDWLHLLLLSVIGNGLLEAVGRQNPFMWESKLFYQFSLLYIFLIVILWFASLSLQFAQWIAVAKKLALELDKEKEKDKEKGSGNDCETGVNSQGRGSSDNTSEDTDPTAELNGLLQLGKDWIWQPIVAQAAIFFCLMTFLIYINNEGDTSSILLGFLVQGASPWSLLYSSRVLILSLKFLITKLAKVTKVRHALCRCWCTGKPSKKKETCEDDNDHQESMSAPEPTSSGTGPLLQGITHRSTSISHTAADCPMGEHRS